MPTPTIIEKHEQMLWHAAATPCAGKSWECALGEDAAIKGVASVTVQRASKPDEVGGGGNVVRSSYVAAHLGELHRELRRQEGEVIILYRAQRGEQLLTARFRADGLADLLLLSASEKLLDDLILA